MILAASFLVLGQTTLTSPLEENPTSLCAYNTASVMEPQEKLENANITPEIVRSSKYCKEYFSIINVIKKVEASESTKTFLQICIKNQVIPKTFQDKRKPYGLNDEETLTWNKKVFETDTCYVALAYLKTKRQVKELIQNVNNQKQCFLKKICENNRTLFEEDFQLLSTNLRKKYFKSREEKLTRLKVLNQPSGRNSTSVIEQEEIIDCDESDSNNNSDATTENDATQSDSDSSTNTNKKPKRNRRWIPRPKYRRLKKKQLKSSINLVYNFSSLELSDAAKSLLNSNLTTT